MTEEEMFEIAREASLMGKKKTSSSTSRSRKPFKKLSEEERRDKIRLGLLKKKESEKTVLELVETLLESRIDPFWFEKEALPSLNQTYYKDVVEERSLLKLCGYALCPNALPAHIPAQKYRIALDQKKVYDLTERKKFCSNACFNGSSFIMEQLDNEPLWLREAPSYKSPRAIRILEAKSSLHLGSEISLSSAEPPNIGDTKSFEDPKSHEEDIGALEEDELEKELEALPDVDELFEALNIHESTTKKEVKPLTSKITIQPPRKQSPLNRIASRLKDWCTAETLRYLKGDDFVWACLNENNYGVDKILSVLGETPNLSSEELVSFNKLIVGDIAKNKVTETFRMDPTENLKIMAFLQGKTEITPEDEDSPSDRSLPAPLNRRTVVWNQLNSVLPEILSLFGLQSSDVMEDLGCLIRGFYLTPSNIIFSKHEWTLLSLLILEMIREKNVRLRTILKSKEAKKYLNMLLLNFDLDEKGLLSIVQGALSDFNLLVNKGAFEKETFPQ